MKKKILFILALAAVLLSACKMKLSENTGTVIIDFGSNERAVDTNGLPVIKDAAISLEIISSNVSEKIDFAAGQEKTWSGSFPVGERIGIKVTISTASAVWKGYAEHTVTSGTNPVSVKLKKAAAALNSLLFGTNKPYTSSVNDYTFTLKIGSKEVKKERINYHNFCRDNKGRTYLVYNTGNRWNIERYTSEGGYDKTFSVPNNTSIGILASDHATGAVYALVSNSSAPYPNVCRIKEDGSFEEITLGESKYIGNIAVYNDILIAYINNRKLSSFKISGNKAEKLKDYALNDDQKIELQNQGTSTTEHSEIKDLYMTENSLYVLFSTYQTSWKYFSLGGIVKYSYNPADGTISNPVRIGIADSHTAQNGIYPTDESNFYGPVKVIGFDEENLYIADDGVKFEFQKGKPRITANKNRIAALKKEDDTLTFTDAPSGITWMGENPVWTGVSTKTIVWTKSSTGHGFDYYQLDSYNTVPATGNSIAASESSDNHFTDVFCFDEAGNIYIVGYSSGNFSIHRFELKDDGSYDSSATVSTTLPDKPVAIAVDISGAVKNSAAQPVNALYCSYDDSDKSYIKRLTWERNAPFFSVVADTSFAGSSSGTFGGPQDVGNNKTRFTALAADKNGFYVGETFKEEDPTTKKYAITVKKYTHNTTGYGTPESTIEVVPATTYKSYSPGADIFSPFENLTDLSIQDGVLYGVTAKEFRNDENGAGEPQKASISGKLWKIGKTDTAFTADTLKRLHSSEPDPLPGSDAERKEGGKFAPYRFIAVMPKKMVIASDGFYGYVESPTSRKADQYNFIWTFELKADGSTGDPNSTDKGTDVSFSKSLDNDSYFAWE
ncbi:hypothetical protein [Treponema denticola]|uniref:hypothetical protein n=1 Tax=Treponema denticola TaxID=158 RepID=UPI002105B57D|nr:hypothetical protein [Treponema denticola]UTY24333.1 hypothetical protein E4N78_09545 [Treponema denticola]